MATPLEISNPIILPDAYKVASRTDESSLKTLCEFWSSRQVEEPIDDTKYTILHFLAFYGNSVAIRRLREKKLLTTTQLRQMRDAKGDTALHVAARFGHLSVVKEFLDGERDLGGLISLLNNSDETPILIAAASGKEEVLYFLMGKVSRKLVIDMKTKEGSTILHVAIKGQHFESAFSILKAYRELAHRPDKNGITPLYLLACYKSSFQSGSVYYFKNLSSSPFIPWTIVAIFLYYLSHTPVHDWNPVNQSFGCCFHIWAVFFAGYRHILKALPLVKSACEARERHVYAKAVASEIVKDQKNWPRTQPSEDSSADPLIKAIRSNIMELVKLILKKFPEAATVVDENKRNILHVAAEIKNPYMYEYLKRRVSNEKKLLSDVDRYGNLVLHLAAGHKGFPKTAHSPLYGMAWDVFWYKHVKGDTPRHLIHHQNLCGWTAKEVFRKTHIGDPKDEQENGKKGLTVKEVTNTQIGDPKDEQENQKKGKDNQENENKGKETVLIKEAAEEAKKVNEGLMIVSVLISTINFAAIFTIPGGFSQQIGIPFFFEEKHTAKHKELKFFLLYIGASLLASLVALGAQLSIQLSRFRKIDFYYILPTKIFIATTALYYSTTFAITACFQAYILEEALGSQITKVMMMACIPAALVYFDLVYYIMNYLYFPIWYKFFAVPFRAIGSVFSMGKKY